MEYVFDRYYGGRLMAQGAKITKAENLEQAVEMAHALFDDNFKRQNFKLKVDNK